MLSEWNEFHSTATPENKWYAMQVLLVQGEVDISRCIYLV